MRCCALFGIVELSLDNLLRCAVAHLHNVHAGQQGVAATTVEVYRDRLEITRYDGDSVHDLGSDGAADPYKGGIDEGLIGPEKYSRAVPSPQQVDRKAAGF